jgi:hypothetical protein
MTNRVHLRMIPATDRGSALLMKGNSRKIMYQQNTLPTAAYRPWHWIPASPAYTMPGRALPG